ncbi:MAG TPA: DUF1802 domain-containing protein [Cyanobacteria bacterium UBA8803]|nr:DUF1802 domain-containing protein [Cyanobacteria bacterium UBA8803]
MSQSVSIQTALCLPAPDIAALIQGRTIAAIPRIFINPGRQFALYPAHTLLNPLPLERYYRLDFLPIAQRTLATLGSEIVVIQAWARCELCQAIDESELLDILSQLTVWTKEALQETCVNRGNIFLAYLRVYLLPQPIEISRNSNSRFIPLLKPVLLNQVTPVLSDRLFNQRKCQLENRLPPPHPELAELQSAIAQLSSDNPAVQALDGDIRILLGWSNNQTVKQEDSDLAWIHKIAEVGNSSDGQEFEKLVRRGLIKLGFTNSNRNPKATYDPEATGGAGGIDFYCEKPYPVVGECKASKKESVPNSVTAQLIHLGVTHLGQEQFGRSIKLIVAAGPLTEPALRAAIENKMNVIRPETLERLVELQAQYRGSIDLLQLKQCLQQAPFGLADDKVNNYIAQVNQKIQLRSHIVRLVKNYLENANAESAGVDALYAVYVVSSPPQPLTAQQLSYILIELSSPLTGYLGRNEDSDRFYFLRDLSVTDPH